MSRLFSSYVCLSIVCLCVGKLAETSYEHILMKFLGGMGHDPSNNLLILGLIPIIGFVRTAYLLLLVMFPVFFSFILFLCLACIFCVPFVYLSNVCSFFYYFPILLFLRICRKCLLHIKINKTRNLGQSPT